MDSIFLIEDDGSLRRELGHLLELAGYRVQTCDEDFPNAASKVLAADPSCVVLDLKLPGTDGHSICRDIRAASSVPIIMLTSSESDFDEIMGMNLGADDYVTKPFNPAVLIARIQARLRRCASPVHLTHKGVTLDLGSGRLSFNGAEADLTRNEMRILALLMRNPGQIISRREIMVELWDTDSFIDDNTLTVNVNRLRKTLGSLGVPEGFLVTRRGQGYLV